MARPFPDRWGINRDHDAAIELLRRIDKGDEAAFREIAPLLKRIDERSENYAKAERAYQQRKIERSTKGRKNSGKFEIAPASEGGVAWSSTGIVLLRTGMTRLVWRSGGKFFSGIGMQSYAPADLYIVYPPMTGTRPLSYRYAESLTNHHTNGTKAERLTLALVMKHQKRIDEVFGAGAAGKVTLTETVVLEERP